MQEVINSFPGYEYVVDENGKKHNMFRGEDVGFGGYVYSEPGMYGRTVVFDVQSMHPHSITAMNVFGDHTPRYKAILEGRVALKHKDMETARKMFDIISPEADKYLQDESMAKPLANAMKLVLNMAYGYTSGSFANPMRDSRNVNNIVALRGALFMVTLRDEVQARGYKVISIKTDSIKVVEPSDELQQFIFDFGKKYGYTFEIENIFSKICLVNDSTFIAMCAPDDPETPNQWLAKAAQFQVPYVFKTLFSKEPIVFDDLCETKSVAKGALYLDMNEELQCMDDEYERELKKFQSMYKKVGKDIKKYDPDISEEELEEMIMADNKVMQQFLYASELEKKLKDGHNLQFVGRVGRFCPIKPGCGGGILYRIQDGKHYAATGTTGYRWLEAEYVDKYGLHDYVDISYFNKLVDDAVEAIGQYGDIEWFINGDPNEPPKDFINVPNMEEAPLLKIPEGIDEEVPFEGGVIVNG